MSYIAVLLYLSGIGMDVLYSVPFFKTVRVFYFFVGVVFAVVGMIHFLDWIKLQNGRSDSLWLPLLDDGNGKASSPLLGRILVFSFAFVFNATATIWPNNKFINFYANYLYVPGRFMETVWLLAVYSLMLIVPFVLAMYWVRLTSPEGLVAGNMSKAKIVVSAVVLGLGVSLIYVFH
jgi:hypothetical protein